MPLCHVVAQDAFPPNRHHSYTPLAWTSIPVQCVSQGTDLCYADAGVKVQDWQMHLCSVIPGCTPRGPCSPSLWLGLLIALPSVTCQPVYFPTTRQATNRQMSVLPLSVHHMRFRLDQLLKLTNWQADARSWHDQTMSACVKSCTDSSDCTRQYSIRQACPICVQLLLTKHMRTSSVPFNAFACCFTHTLQAL